MRLLIDENDQVILDFDTSDEEKEIRELASARTHGTYVNVIKANLRRANQSHSHSPDRNTVSEG
ncbi:MAG: hypothetical protein F4092_13130 [Rhodospirillaceae bacterium]|nr:hypothetical protein [Rhodospirillaceae bacterium]